MTLTKKFLMLVVLFVGVVSMSQMEKRHPAKILMDKISTVRIVNLRAAQDSLDLVMRIANVDLGIIKRRNDTAKKAIDELRREIATLKSK